MTDDEAFDQYITEHEKAAPAKTAPRPAAQPKSDDQLFDEYIATHHVDSTPEKTAEHAAQVEQSVPSGYATTTATTPSEVKRENKAQAREDFGRGAFSDAATAAGYGLLRGGTLGFSDRLAGAGASLAETFGANGEPDGGGQPYAEMRQQYLADEAKAKEGGGTVANMAGEVAGGILPTVATGGLSNAFTGGRLVQAGLLGGAAGVGNTQSDKPADLAKGFGVGAGTGLVVEGTVGTALRKLFRGAPERQENAVLRDVMESDAGRATPTAGMKLVKDLEDVRDVLRKDKDLAEAVRLPAKEAAPQIEAKASQVMDGQDARYDAVNKALVKQPLTVTSLLQKLVDIEQKAPSKMGPAIAKAMEGVRDDIRNYWAPRWGSTATWSGQRVEVSSQELREWLSSVQASAEMKMGGINGTATYKVPAAVSGLCNDILEARLDQAAAKGAKHAVDGIREADRQYSAIMRIAEAVDSRGLKEQAQAIGLTQRIANTHSRLAVPALVASGHLEAAAAVAMHKSLLHAAGAAGRFVNDRMLAPVQRAAEVGAPWGQAVRSASEAAPQAVGRTAEPAIAPRAPFVPSQPTLRQAFASPTVAPSMDVSGYRTGVATQ